MYSLVQKLSISPDLKRTTILKYKLNIKLPVLPTEWRNRAHKIKRGREDKDNESPASKPEHCIHQITKFHLYVHDISEIIHQGHDCRQLA